MEEKEGYKGLVGVAERQELAWEAIAKEEGRESWETNLQGGRQEC